MCIAPSRFARLNRRCVLPLTAYGFCISLIASTRARQSSPASHRSTMYRATSPCVRGFGGGAHVNVRAADIPGLNHSAKRTKCCDIVHHDGETPPNASVLFLRGDGVIVKGFHNLGVVLFRDVASTGRLNDDPRFLGFRFLGF